MPARWVFCGDSRLDGMTPAAAGACPHRQGWVMGPSWVLLASRTRRADPGMPVPAPLIRRLPASRQLPVHKHVDGLCRTMPGLCILGGNAGDSAACPQRKQRFYLGKH